MISIFGTRPEGDAKLCLGDNNLFDCTADETLADGGRRFWPALQAPANLIFDEKSLFMENLGNVIVAEKEEQIIGFYSFSAKDSPPEMNNLFVLPKFIGKGVGFQLWSHAIEFARSNGWEYFMMDADPYAAEKFYYKMGCYKIGDVESTVRKGRFIPKLRSKAHGSLAKL